MSTFAGEPSSSTTNGNVSPPDSPPVSGAPSAGRRGTHIRSASFQKGVAVIKALARAPEDPEPPSTPFVVSDDDETTEGVSSVVDGKSIAREARDGLRRRAVGAKEGAEVVAKASESALANPKKKKKSKSWEIPRKIFHSSIGFLVLYLYLSKADMEKVVRALSIFLGIVVTADVIRLNNDGFERIYEKVLGFLMREAEKKQVNGVVWYLIGVLFSLHFFPADIASLSVVILSWADTSASVFGRIFGRYTPPLPSPPFASRKSSAGFMAAAIAGGLSAYLFWGTSVAISGERSTGLSWSPEYAFFGTLIAPGPAGSGWAGWKHGIRPSPPPEAALDDVAANLRFATFQPVAGMPLPLLCIGTGLVTAVAEALELGGVDDNLSLPILSATGIWFLLWAWGFVKIQLLARGV